MFSFKAYEKQGTCPKNNVTRLHEGYCNGSCVNDSACEGTKKCCLGTSGCNQCTEPEGDSCDPECLNGGICSMGKCDCSQGYTGNYCETGIIRNVVSGTLLFSKTAMLLEACKC